MNLIQKLLTKLDAISKDQRFFLLLAAIVTFLFWQFLGGDRVGVDFVGVTLSSLLLLAAIDCLRFTKRSFLISKVFGVLVLMLGWIDAATDISWLDTISGLFRILFFLLVTGALISQVAKSARVSLSIIVGAISGYLLLGIVGAVAALVVDTLVPGAYAFNPETHLGTSKYFYYSYITLSTVGYGDITPSLPIAQFLSIMLGVAGQLYIATIIAILVGKYVSGKSPSD